MNYWWDGKRWWTSREAMEQIARLTAERDEALKQRDAIQKLSDEIEDQLIDAREAARWLLESGNTNLHRSSVCLRYPWITDLKDTDPRI